MTRRETDRIAVQNSSAIIEGRFRLGQEALMDKLALKRRNSQQFSFAHYLPWRARWLGMKRSPPKTPEGWLLEIRLAIKDARGAEQSSTLIGDRIADANLFHLAPLVCLKFRGRRLIGREADRVGACLAGHFIGHAEADPLPCLTGQDLKDVGRTHPTRTC